MEGYHFSIIVINQNNRRDKVDIFVFERDAERAAQIIK